MNYARFAARSTITVTCLLRNGRSIVDPRIKSVRVNADRIQVSYEDGRDLAVPVTFYWRLADATPEQLQNFEISPSGRGIHWPDVDEDLSAKGLLEGMPRATVSA